MHYGGIGGLGCFSESASEYGPFPGAEEESSEEEARMGTDTAIRRLSSSESDASDDGDGMSCGFRRASPRPAAVLESTGAVDSDYAGLDCMEFGGQQLPNDMARVLSAPRTPRYGRLIRICE